MFVANAFDDEFVQRRLCPGDRLLTILAVNDELREHRIVIRRHHRAAVHTVSNRTPGPLGGWHERNTARGRHEISIRIFGVDAALDGMAVHFMSSCVNGSGSPAAIRICCLTKSIPVTASVTGCSTWMRVFISKKVKVAVARPTKTPPYRHWCTRPRARHRTAASPIACAQLRSDRRRRRLLDELLVATLDGALPLAQVDDVAVLVRQHLNFDVARHLDHFFDVHVGVAERGLRLGASHLERAAKFVARRTRRACPCRHHRPRP